MEWESVAGGSMVQWLCSDVLCTYEVVGVAEQGVEMGSRGRRLKAVRRQPVVASATAAAELEQRQVVHCAI